MPRVLLRDLDRQRRDMPPHRIPIDNYVNYNYSNYCNFKFLEACMAKSVVTQERVFEVAAALTERGEEPGHPVGASHYWRRQLLHRQALP